MKFKRLLSLVMIAAMLMTMVQMQVSAVDWDISKSKTATALDVEDISQVTLSLPAAEYKREMDVVIVLDDSHHGSQIFKKLVTDLLEELNSFNSMYINIGVIAFDAVSRDWMSATTDGALSGLVPLHENYNSIYSALTDELSYDKEGKMVKVGGTNTEWPVDMANDMLENSTAEEKYIIMFSDFYGYMYRGEYKVGDKIYQNVPVSVVITSQQIPTLSTGTKYDNFEDVLNNYEEPNIDTNSFFRDSSWDTYWSVYRDSNDTIEPGTQFEASQKVENGSYSGFETSIYMTYQNLVEVSNNANVILINNEFTFGDSPYVTPIKNEFLSKLEENDIICYKFPHTELDSQEPTVLTEVFDNIKKDLIQVVDDGSYVVDVIGEDFNFVNNIDNITLTVGGVELEKNIDSTDPNKFIFGSNNDFTLTYYENGTDKSSAYGKNSECFVWEINVPILKSAPVKLTYSVKLVNKSTDLGTHETATNESAILYPVDSDGNEGTAEVFEVPKVTYSNEKITITPIDMTIYMGGDDGYSAVVDGTDTTSSDSLPPPLFHIALPEGLTEVDPKDIILSGSDNRAWTITCIGSTSDDKPIYDILPNSYDDQDPVRVTYSKDGETYISDEFEPTEIDEVFTDFDIDIYAGNAGAITATYKGKTYSVDSGTGKLRVRAVANYEDGNPVSIVENNVAEVIAAGEAAITAPTDTEYYLNDTTVRVADRQDVGLLFDGIINDAENNRTQAMLDALTDRYGEADGNYAYQAQYLDLVDTRNGNAWVKASTDVNVYWGYPDGTDQNTEFMLYHFVNLHRDNADGANSGFDINEVSSANIEIVPITLSEYGINFTVEPGGFSPFVLVWSVEDEDDDTPIIIPIDNELIVTKTISGNLADENAEFTFMIELDRNVNGNYNGVVFVNGVAYVTLKGGESIVIEDLAPGTTYKVTELDSGEYEVTANNDTGTIPYLGSVNVEFNNHLQIDAPELNTTDHVGYLIGRAPMPPYNIYPTDNMTRAEVATVFFRLLTDEARAENWTQENNYSDVELDDWYNNAISTISAMGIMNGYPDGTFAPNASITRAEFITTAVRFFDYTAEYFEGTFIDVDGTEWFADYIAAGVELGMIEGYPDGSFLPNEAILRCEVAAIVNRTLGRVPDEDHLLDTDEMINWEDNLPGSWYYAHMQEASNSHDLEWVVEDGKLVEQWIAKFDERDWAALERAWSDAYSAPGAEVID